MLLLSAGCRPAATTRPASAPSAPAATSCPAAPDLTALDHRVRIFDAAGHEHTLATLLDALAEHRVVLLGETHTDDVTHQVEQAVLEGLAERHDDRVVLSMEMFQRDVQPVLDRYLAGELDEAAMLEQARPWPNYRTGYRPLVETARVRGLPVRAANAPNSTLMRAVQGEGPYQELRAEHPAWLPAEVLPADDAYWARVDRTIRGHSPGRGRDRTYSVQNLWDNAMADTVVQAAAAHPEHAVLHVAGGFHVERHEGTVAQIRRRAPDLDLVTLSVRPTSDLASAEPAPALADFVVYAEDYAQGPSGDTLAVTMPASLGYRLSLPDAPAPEGGWPLLIWLADDEQRPDDAALRWRMALGDAAAVIVVEPPLRTRAREGWLVRRWAWPATWSADLSAATIGLARILEYARRRLPIRADAVLIAGEGSGGTLALWTALYAGDDEPGVRVTALDPRLPRALQTASIPDERSAVAALEIYGEPDEGTLAGLQGVGLAPRVRPAPPPGPPREARVRAALGVPEPAAAPEPPRSDPAAPSARPGQPLDVRLAEPSALSTSWAALYASLLGARGHDAHLVLGDAAGTPGARTLAFDGPPAANAELLLGVFAEGEGLPGTPDAFAGAVVLLVPRGVPSRIAQRWVPLLEQREASQGFVKTPYRVVREGDAKEIARVLDQLREQGRTEVLVVPVELCATGPRMLGYMETIERAADGLSLHWLPGLGHHAIDILSSAPPS